MKTLTLELPTEHDTEWLGATLARLLPTPAIIGLNGPLGAGKTRLVQSLAHAVDVPRQEVLSPTFVLVRQYEGERTIFHLDTYRLVDEDEFWALGPEEFFDARAWTLIEWANRFSSCLPAERLDIELEHLAGDQRRAILSARGELYARVLQQLAELAAKRLAT